MHRFLLILLATLPVFHACAQDAENWVDPGDMLLTVNGVVCDELGVPVEGAKVYFKDPQRLRQRDFSPVAVTDDEGRFTLTYSEAGALRHPLMAESADGTLIGAWGKEFEWHREEVLPRVPVWDTPSRDPVTGMLRLDGYLSWKNVRSPRIILLPATRMTGRVLNGAGEPVSGAYVGVQTHHRGLTELDGTTTDADGRFSLRFLKDSVPTLVFAIHPEHGGYICDRGRIKDPETNKNQYKDPLMRALDQNVSNRSRDPQPSVDGLMIKLRHYPTRVRLQDDKTGGPRTDVCVQPAKAHDLELPPVFQAKPDEKGVARFPWVQSPQGWMVFDPVSGLSDPIYGSQTEKLGVEYIIRVPFTVQKIYGTVTFPDGTPAAKIAFGPEIDDYHNRDNRSGTVFRTDARGRYVFYTMMTDPGRSPFGGRTPGLLTPQVPGFRNMKIAREESSDGGKILRRDIQLVPSNVIRGRVTLEHPEKGKIPYPGAEVGLSRMLMTHYIPYGSIPPSERYTQTTDENGEYRFEVSHGYFSVSGRKRDSEIHFPASEPAEAVHDIQVPWQPVTIRVTDTAGQPLSGMEVGVARLDGTLEFGKTAVLGLDAEAVTDANGVATLPYLTHNDYAFLARDPEKKRYGLAVRASGAAELEIAVAPPVEVEGRLVEEKSGKPLAGHEFVLQPVWENKRYEYGLDAPLAELDLPVIRGETDEEGRFRVAGLINGVDYSIRIRRRTRDGNPLPCLFGGMDHAGILRADSDSQGAAECKVTFNARRWSVFASTGGANDTLKQFAALCRLAEENGQDVILWTGLSDIPGFGGQMIAMPETQQMLERFLILTPGRMSVLPDRDIHAGVIAEKLGITPEDFLNQVICVFDAKTGLLLRKSPQDVFVIRKPENRKSAADHIRLDAFREFLEGDGE